MTQARCGTARDCIDSAASKYEKYEVHEWKHLTEWMTDLTCIAYLMNDPGDGSSIEISSTLRTSTLCQQPGTGITLPVNHRESLKSGTTE
jgi:hypothetical protein